MGSSQAHRLATRLKGGASSHVLTSSSQTRPPQRWNMIQIPLMGYRIIQWL
jgi:hypothetical protein